MLGGNLRIKNMVRKKRGFGTRPKRILKRKKERGSREGKVVSQPMRQRVLPRTEGKKDTNGSESLA